MNEIKVENIVATASIGNKMDLEVISAQLEGSEYNKNKFPGLIFRLKKPKSALLLFSTGKVVCTGTKSLEEADTAINTLIKTLEKTGFSVNRCPEIIIQNIVATSDLNAKLKLNVIAITLGLENIEYEPEQFPGLVYRIEDLQIVALLFGSGKVVFTGAKDLKNIEKARVRILKELNKAGLIG